MIIILDVDEEKCIKLCKELMINWDKKINYNKVKVWFNLYVFIIIKVFINLLYLIFLYQIVIL